MTSKDPGADSIHSSRMILLVSSQQSHGEKIKSMAASTGMDYSFCIAENAAEAESMLQNTKCCAIVSDHPPDEREAALARSNDLPMVDASSTIPSALMDSEENENACSCVLEMIITHAIEKHQLYKALDHYSRQAESRREAVEEARRLAALLKMIGVEAHAMKQPLTILMGNIELMGMNMDDPEKVKRYMDKIADTGEAINEIIKKIQELRHEHSEHDMALPGGGLDIIFAGENKDKLTAVKKMLENHTRINVSSLCSPDESACMDCGLVLVDYSSSDDQWMNLAQTAKKAGRPVVLVADRGDEMAAAKAVENGRGDFAVSSSSSESALIKSLISACESHHAAARSKEAVERHKNMVLKDEMTSLCSRAYFTGAVEREISRLSSTGRESSLGIIKIDNLESIFDECGPKSHSAILSQLGSIMRRACDIDELPCRYGHDEFSALLPNHSAEKAMEWMKKVENSIIEKPFEWFGKNMPFHTTVGVIKLDENSAGQGKHWESLIKLELEREQSKKA